MRKSILLTAGFIILFAAEILKVYFIMPFPGSQRSNSIDIAYFLHRHIIWFRVIGSLLVLPSLLTVLRNGRPGQRIFLSALVILYAVVFYFFNFRFLADKMFYQPGNKRMLTVAANQVDTNQLVIAAYMNGEARAYPIQIIGYHHQVQDSIGGTPVLVTYCTVCRTGRIYSPMIQHVYQHFRLVGMDHFNAMFEDETSKSWWRQVTGEAIAGPMKGQQLTQLPSSQMRLGTWISRHPNTLVLQPDTVYNTKYADLEGFDSGTIKSSLEKRDSASWKFKSWVVGVVESGHARAYDWNQVVKEKVINDQLQQVPLVVQLDRDGMSFHVWKRNVGGQTLQFNWNDSSKLMNDAQTGSSWNGQGYAIQGPLQGSQLAEVQAYQEFWHSWQNFHPNTTTYR
ncbi:MAG TPA: DUF3179 domain-containing (seleno)protein [Puia sp.]|nr:DUF3179 domain-containing (seleno)protein [Puia sp.]